jgi:thioredoxin 1
MSKSLYNLEEFNEVINNQDVNRLVIIFYTASWCGPCKYIYPLIEELCERVPHIYIFKVDVDNDGEGEENKISSVTGVTSMPTFHFYKNKEKIDELCGANKIELLQKIKIHSCII